jgi:hypothetical protein
MSAAASAPSGPRTRASDYALGVQNEQSIQGKLETFLGCSLVRAADPFSPLDFHNDTQTVWGETKRRFCNRTRYPTVVLGKNKVDFLRVHGGVGAFCWVYDDGVFGIRYDEGVFRNFTVANFQRLDRGDDPNSLVYHIPVELLEPM